MNTLIEYMYRDGNNYKQHERLIVVGAVDIEAFNRALDNEGGFIPSQIGLQDLQGRFTDIAQDSDHVWHEPIEITHTEQETTYAVRASDINKLVQVILKKGWDVNEAMIGVGLELEEKQ